MKNVSVMTKYIQKGVQKFFMKVEHKRKCEKETNKKM